MSSLMMLGDIAINGSLLVVGVIVAYYSFCLADYLIDLIDGFLSRLRGKQ